MHITYSETVRSRIAARATPDQIAKTYPGRPGDALLQDVRRMALECGLTVREVFADAPVGLRGDGLNV